MSVYRRIARAADINCPYWVALVEDKCTGAQYHRHRDFCREQGLLLSNHGHSVVWQNEWYHVFQFAEDEHAERFIQEFGGERMHPSEKGQGKRWAQWKKGTYKPKPKSPYDFKD